MDVLRGALRVVDKLIVAVGVNGSKKPLFSFEEKLLLIKSAAQEAFADAAAQIEIIYFDNLLVDTARALGATIIIRGLRDGTDLDYEMQLSSMNSVLAPEIQTLFFPASISGRAITSNIVRQIASLGGDVSLFVPEVVMQALSEKFKQKRRNADD